MKRCEQLKNLGPTYITRRRWPRSGGRAGGDGSRTPEYRVEWWLVFVEQALILLLGGGLLTWVVRRERRRAAAESV